MRNVHALNNNLFLTYSLNSHISSTYSLNSHISSTYSLNSHISSTWKKMSVSATDAACCVKSCDAFERLCIVR